MRRALRSNGRLVMDLNNLVARLCSYQPSRVEVRENGDMFVDRFHLAPLTSRLEVERTIVRDGQVRRVPFVVRLFSFPEIKDFRQASTRWPVTVRTETHSLPNMSGWLSSFCSQANGDCRRTYQCRSRRACAP
jgi:hypothetical protein